MHGVEHEIRVDVDAESGKTFIRVDGRMAAQPMAATEGERGVTVAGASYVVRREGAGFEVALAEQPAEGTAPVPPPPDGRVEVPAHDPILTVRRVVMAVVVIAVLLILRWGYDVRSYLRVQWKPYMGPQARFRVSFPGDPAESTQDITVANGKVTANILTGSYRKHEYDFFWFELPAPTNEQADPLLAKILANIVENEKGTLDRSDPHYYDGHSALMFTIQVPASDDRPRGALRGRLILCRAQRIYCMFAFTPTRDALSFDVGEYLRSLTLAEDEGTRRP